MTFISTSRTAAAIAATICMAIPATAQADYTSRTDATQLAGAWSAGDDGRTIASPARQRSALEQERYYSSYGTSNEAESTFPAADSSYGTSDEAESTFPAADFRRGDNPAEHPGMSRAPQYDGPTTVEVVRPERTIVRDVDEALPIALSSTALLLVLATLAGMLVRGRLVPRPGRSS
jgi:hypothetical protein